MVRRSRGLVVATAAACVEVLLTMLGTSGGVGAETLVWSEEFDVFDLSVWNHLVSGSRGFNNEFEYYRNNRKNSFVKDGVLYLKPTLTAADYGERFLYQGGLSHRDCNLSPCETVYSPTYRDSLVAEEPVRFKTNESSALVGTETKRSVFVWGIEAGVTDRDTGGYRTDAGYRSPPCMENGSCSGKLNLLQEI
uniref:Uncharacterized protein n=1 Tax=Timema tahoe TaxID=61484 RepID=A0A7R9II54_9NEOP|nr:unnamed protein product [Timema tahoe]